jgi:hypothetical protein
MYLISNKKMTDCTRHRADKYLINRSNVCATSFGLKRTKGKLTKDFCYIVYVDKKFPPSKLSKKDMIPKTITRYGEKHKTDVVEIAPFRFQSGTTYGIRDDVNSGGTLTCFARSKKTDDIDGDEFYALSCAHVVWGRDKIINNDPIQIWDQERWVSFGSSLTGLNHRGSGTAPDFGFIDAGLVSIEHPQMQQLARSSDQLSILPIDEFHNDALSLIGTLVTAESIVSKSNLHGIITDVYFSDPNNNLYVDLIIRNPESEPLTFVGDSGLLWKDFKGNAVAMHSMGEDFGPDIGQPSRLSASTFFYKIVERLDIVPLR